MLLPRGAERDWSLILHAHDTCLGLGVAFEPPADMCRRLREHTFGWPMWTLRVAQGTGAGISRSDDPWGDLLAGSGRSR